MGCDIAVVHVSIIQQIFSLHLQLKPGFPEVPYLTEPNSQLWRHSGLHIKIFWKVIFATYILFPGN